MSDGDRASMRSALGQATGLGSAKSGVQHWWWQRVTAVALVPLLLWFVASVIAHIGADRTAIHAWLGAPIPAIIMLCLLVAGFYHMALGVQVVIEDYVARGLRVPALILNRLICLLLAVAGVYAVLRLAMGG